MTRQSKRGKTSETEASVVANPNPNPNPTSDVTARGDGPKRCSWAKSEIDIIYHDQEWGVPSRDDRHLFEMICLEGQQAGLSWTTILKKRNAYRKAFHNFDAKLVAAFDEAQVTRLLTQDSSASESIVRHRGKVEAIVSNAKQAIKCAEEFGSFSAYCWGFVGDVSVCNHWRSGETLPSLTDASVMMSKDMKTRGFKFVGPKICYAFMQAVGMVNDHIVSCKRHAEVQQPQF